MNPLYKSIAACPACHGSLTWPTPGAGAAAACVCQSCGRRYAVIDGVPLLRLDAGGEPLPAPPPQVAQPQSWLRRLSRLTEVPGFSHKTAASRQSIPRFIAGLGPQALILNLGSGQTHFGPRVVNLDIGPFANVDVVAVGERLPVHDTCLDAVITQGVLEHVPDLRSTLAEIDRVLRPGGQVYHEVPFIQGFHGSPDDYRRFTRKGLRELAEGYEILDTGVIVGPSSGVAWIASDWLALLFSFGNASLFKLARRAFGWLLTPLKYADAWLEQHPQAELIASAFFIIAQKPQPPLPSVPK